MLDFRMETFLALCRTMNYTRAAEELRITQPAVTQHIQYLQRHYGVKLFSYHDKRLALTEAGEALHSAALTMEHDERELRQRLPLLEKGRQHLRLGATLTVGEYALPPHLARYMKRHPEITVHLVVGSTRNLLAQIDRGALDAAIVEGYFPRGEYDAIPWSAEPFVGVCAADSALPARLALADLFSQPLILRDPESGSREILERALRERNYQLSDFARIVEINDLTVIKQLVEQNCGVTFLYRRAVTRELAEGRLRALQIENWDIRHEFTFLWRAGSVFETQYRRLYEQLCCDREDNNEHDRICNP
ncbi:MAG TPA: LysR family transcriptional regulator [Firmicutes bacterium]|nr:LysR family transcriptional regulator [Bacillota bacterium]